MTKAAGVALLAGSLASFGCGPKPCTSCPDLSGNWNITFTSLSAFTGSQSGCSWVISTNSPYPFTISDSGSSITLTSPAGTVYNGTIYENSTASVQGNNTSTLGTVTDNFSDFYQFNLSGTTAFSGSLTESLTETDNSVSPPKSTTCQGTAQLNGQKQ